MKATLEFTLPEDQVNFNAATKALDWALVALSLDNHLRSSIKYGDLGDEQIGQFEHIRSRLAIYMDDHGVSFEDIN